MLPTKDELRRRMGEAYGAWYWRTPGRFAHKPGAAGKAERVRLILEYRQHRSAISAGRCRDENNARGNVVLRDIDADRAVGLGPRAMVSAAKRTADRYLYDFEACRTWAEFPTPQDAHYFGVWFDRSTRQTFTYCEGDRILVTCPTEESFAAELAHAAEFYGAPIPEPGR